MRGVGVYHLKVIYKPRVFFVSESLSAQDTDSLPRTRLSAPSEELAVATGGGARGRGESPGSWDLDSEQSGAVAERRVSAMQWYSADCPCRPPPDHSSNVLLQLRWLRTATVSRPKSVAGGCYEVLLSVMTAQIARNTQPQSLDWGPSSDAILGRETPLLGDGHQTTFSLLHLSSEAAALCHARLDHLTALRENCGDFLQLVRRNLHFLMKLFKVYSRFMVSLAIVHAGMNRIYFPWSK